MSEDYGMSYDQWCVWKVNLLANRFQETLNLDDDFPKEKGELLSDCCGAPPLCNGDSDFTDIGICPDCGEHCEFI